MVKSVLLTFFRQFAGILFGLGTTILLARGFGNEDYGIYAIALLWVNLLSQFLNLGVPAANVFFIASKKSSLKASLSINLFLWLFVSVVTCSILWPLMSIYHSQWFPNIPLELLQISLLGFPFVLLHVLILSFYQAKQKFLEHNLYGVLPQALLFSFVVFQNFTTFSISNTVYFFTISHFVISVWMLIKLKPLMKEDKEQKQSLKSVKDLLKYSSLSHLSNIITFINYRADILLINFFMTPIAVGVYTVTIRLVEKLWIFSQSSSTVILPRLSSLKNENNSVALTLFVGKLVLYVTALSALGFFLLGEWLIVLLFSDKYSESFTAVPYLLPGIVIGSISRIFSNSLAGMNKPQINFYTSLITLSINITLNLLLIPKYGLIGAATATSTAYILSSLIKISIYCRITHTSFFSVFILNKEDVLWLKKLVGK